MSSSYIYIEAYVYKPLNQVIFLPTQVEMTSSRRTIKSESMSSLDKTSPMSSLDKISPMSSLDKSKTLSSLTKSGTMSSMASITQRSVTAYYRHLDRFNLERSKSLGNLNRSVRSGKPAILKPLKLWRPQQGEDKVMWVYGNPWSDSEPRYLRTNSGQMTKLAAAPTTAAGQ